LFDIERSDGGLVLYIALTIGSTGPAMPTKPKILLVDLDDNRRLTRVQILQGAGYEVEVRATHVEASQLNHEGRFDMVIIALHLYPTQAVTYSDELHKNNPNLPILLLTDWGVFVPRGTLSRTLETGSPGALVTQVAAMLAGSTHVREITADLGD
jgi:DNA-binding NarL/FixJ family response regulator